MFLNSEHTPSTTNKCNTKWAQRLHDLLLPGWETCDTTSTNQNVGMSKLRSRKYNMTHGTCDWILCVTYVANPSTIVIIEIFDVMMKEQHHPTVSTSHAVMNNMSIGGENWIMFKTGRRAGMFDNVYLWG